MLSKKNLPLSIGLVIVIELIIYLWAVLTTEPEFVFDKCARNSGRASTALILIILLGIGYFGLYNIYRETKKKEIFQVLILLFSINHFIHLFYVALNFNHHSLQLSISENIHGFITFAFLIFIPIVVFLKKTLNKPLYILLILHLLNVSYFIIKTFLSKITLERPAYHNQFGILILCLAWIYIFYRMFFRPKQNLQKQWSFILGGR